MEKEKWLEENGFSKMGETFIVMGNSFTIKQGLKDIKFKFSPLLRWHGPHNQYVLPPDCWYLQVNYDDYFFWDEEKKTSFLKNGAREKIEGLFTIKRESTSEHIGVVGGKIENLYCKVIHTSGFNTMYGYKWVYTFMDESENEYTWFTTVNKALSAGMWLELSGFIKEHSEYKGVKVTVLTRCKINRVI